MNVGNAQAMSPNGATSKDIAPNAMLRWSPYRVTGSRQLMEMDWLAEIESKW